MYAPRWRPRRSRRYSMARSTISSKPIYVTKPSVSTERTDARFSAPGKVLEVADPTGTAELGRRLGEALFPGAVIGLVGPLGAGKTQLVRAIALGLGMPDGRAVTSPTFVLIQE